VDRIDFTTHPCALKSKQNELARRHIKYTTRCALGGQQKKYNLINFVTLLCFVKTPRIKFGQETEVTEKMLIGFPLSASLSCYYALIINYALHVLAYKEKAARVGRDSHKNGLPKILISLDIYFRSAHSFRFIFLTASPQKIIFSCKMNYLNDKNFRFLLVLLFCLFVSGCRKGSAPRVTF